MGGYSGYQYAMETGNNPFLCMLGGAIIGAAAGYIGADVAQSSIIGGMYSSSFTNSIGWKMMTQGRSDFMLDLGFAQWNVDQGNWDWADFTGNAGVVIGDAMGWMAAVGDAFEVQQGLNSGRERGQRDVARATANPDYVDEGGVPYIEVGSLPENGDAWNVIDAAEPLTGKGSGYSNVSRFKIPNLLEQYPERITDYRTLWGHYKEGKGLFEFHPSAFPVKGLGGLMAVPHVVFESAAFGGYDFRRNYLLPALGPLSRYSAPY
ncbi:MAG: hypothetical protein ABIE70_00615 [bacterium]